ncbi:MAG TPA: hypothetical protein VKO18_04255 [Terriglobia bacterium]|nr:hypothetical protein [Terriglobia bacterium]
MFIMYEYAAGLLAALIGGTFLFTAGAICVMLWTGGVMAWRRWQELASVPNWLMGRWTVEPREP